MCEPFLTCALEVPIGVLTVAASFKLREPWTCLFGASGSGKSTILRALAGFVVPRAGSIELEDGRILFQGSTRINVPPHRRPMRMAAQQAFLFPGTVRRNLRYGIGTQQATSAEEEVLHRFELTSLASCCVSTLSGGQRQRVLLARTVAAALFAREPVALLLLDEPFTGFDLELRNRLALDLRNWLRERNLPVLSVTHDVPEALLLEAETIRLCEGRISAQGPAASVLAQECEILLSTLKQRGPGER